jgi:hypothetical protein
VKFDTTQLLAAIGLKQLLLEAQDEQIRALQAALAEARRPAEDAAAPEPEKAA